MAEEGDEEDDSAAILETLAGVDDVEAKYLNLGK